MDVIARLLKTTLGPATHKMRRKCQTQNGENVPLSLLCPGMKATMDHPSWTLRKEIAMKHHPDQD